MPLKLTDLHCRTLTAPAGARRDVSDALVPGLQLRISGSTARYPNGRKSWALLYRGRDGKQRRRSLPGGYPEVGVKQAREQAQEILRKVKRGEPLDPEPEPELSTATPTVDDTFPQYVAKAARSRGWSKTYRDEANSAYRRYIKEDWGARRVAEIRRFEIAGLVEKIAQTAPYQANRVLSLVKGFFNWAVDQGLIELSPAARLERPGEERARARVLGPDELGIFWRATYKLPYPWGPYLRALTLTMQRRSHVAGMRWDQLELASPAVPLDAPNAGDLDPVDRADAWVFDGEATKGGRPNAVPLAPAVRDELLGCPRINSFVFTTMVARDVPICDFLKLKQKIDAVIAELGGSFGDWRFHDLRRTGATEMRRLGVDRFTVERVLDHSDGTVAAVYDRYDCFPEKRAALVKWADYVLRVAAPGGNVVRLAALGSRHERRRP